jgi:hypothetical protein
LVDKVLGKADPAGGGGDAVGLATVSGKIAYIKSSSFGSAGMISTGVHEWGHNAGLEHDFTDPSNWMSYSTNRGRFSFGQLESIVINAKNGALNQGRNHARAGNTTNNSFWHTSTNEAPFDFNVLQGQKIPKPIPNK